MGNCFSTNKTEHIPVQQTTIKVNEPDIFNADISKIERQTYEGVYSYCRFDNVYDGDTADIFFKEGKTIIRRPFRFYGYDSAEMKQPKNEPLRDKLKEQALSDKQYLISLVGYPNKCVVLFMENEKYGRMMGKIWRIKDDSIPETQLSTHPELIDENYITNIMIRHNHGKPYFGGTK